MICHHGVLPVKVQKHTSSGSLTQGFYSFLMTLNQKLLSYQKPQLLFVKGGRWKETTTKLQKSSLPCSMFKLSRMSFVLTKTKLCCLQMCPVTMFVCAYVCVSWCERKRASGVKNNWMNNSTALLWRKMLSFSFEDEEETFVQYVAHDTQWKECIRLIAFHCSDWHWDPMGTWVGSTLFCNYLHDKINHGKQPNL